MFAWRRSALNRRTIVNLKTGKAFDGTLVAKRGPLLELKGTTLLEPGREPVGLDGAVLVERGNVDFLQIPG